MISLSSTLTVRWCVGGRDHLFMIFAVFDVSLPICVAVNCCRFTLHVRSKAIERYWSIGDSKHGNNIILCVIVIVNSGSVYNCVAHDKICRRADRLLIDYERIKRIKASTRASRIHVACHQAVGEMQQCEWMANVLGQSVYCAACVRCHRCCVDTAPHVIRTSRCVFNDEMCTITLANATWYVEVDLLFPVSRCQSRSKSSNCVPAAAFEAVNVRAIFLWHKSRSPTNDKRRRRIMDILSRNVQLAADEFYMAWMPQWIELTIRWKRARTENQLFSERFGTVI